jgi:hypothetical protein
MGRNIRLGLDIRMGLGETRRGCEDKEQGGLHACFVR